MEANWLIYKDFNILEARGDKQGLLPQYWSLKGREALFWTQSNLGLYDGDPKMYKEHDSSKIWFT